MSDTNGVHKGKYNARYMSYDEATKEITKYSMASLQECIKKTWNLEAPARPQRKILPKATGLYHPTVVT